jgi:hypothetical protein
MSPRSLAPCPEQSQDSDTDCGVAPADEVIANDAETSVVSQLRAVDDVLAQYHLERRIALESQQRTTVERAEFARAACHALRTVVTPALQLVADRLAQDGVGGLVEDRPRSGRFGPGAVLWMSLDGPIVSAPRPDRNPYIQFDIDVDRREVRVWEGDMWLHLGASRPAAPLVLRELTETVVMQRAVTVLQRAADHAKRILADLLPEGALP